MYLGFSVRDGGLPGQPGPGETNKSVYPTVRHHSILRRPGPGLVAGVGGAYNGAMILGSHLSISGGLENALHAADAYGFEAVAMFVRNQRQWKAPPLEPEQIDAFVAARSELAIAPVVAHGSYLVNLAGADDTRAKSIDAVAEDLRRCEALGIEYLVIHPGSNPDAQRGVEQISAGVDEAIDRSETARTMLLLETTAGQGNCLGWQFEQIAAMRAGAGRADRVGYCFDTAHAFAAGYDLRSAESARATIDAFDAACGLEHLRAIHCNDSLKPLGSRVDRHAHIGLGEIGEAGFAALVNDRRLRAVPFILETPKGLRDDGRDWDELNAETLHRLIAPSQ